MLCTNVYCLLKSDLSICLLKQQLKPSKLSIYYHRRHKKAGNLHNCEGETGNICCFCLNNIYTIIGL